MLVRSDHSEPHEVGRPKQRDLVMLSAMGSTKYWRIWSSTRGFAKTYAVNGAADRASLR